MRLWPRRRPVLCRGCAIPTDGEHALALVDPAAAAVVEHARVVVEKWHAAGRPLGYRFLGDVLGASLPALAARLDALDHPDGYDVPRPLEELPP